MKRFLLWFMCTLLFLGGCSSISEKKQALSDSDYLVILTKDQNNEVELCIQHGDKSRKIDEIDPSNINVIEEAQILIYSSPENDVYAYDYSSFDNEVDLIGNNLILDSLIVIPNTKTLLYQDKNQSLYIQNLGEIRKKIASDVNDFKVGQAKKIIYYTSMDNNLYQYIGGENLKIASNVNWFTTDTIGESLIYRDTDNDVYVKWKNQDNIEYLVSGGNYAQFYDDTTILFTRNDNDLYVTKQGLDYTLIEKNISISPITDEQHISKNIRDVVFTDSSNTGYYQSLKDLDKIKNDNDFEEILEEQRFEIADDLMRIEAFDAIVALDFDNNLYVYSKDGRKEKVASDITEVFPFENKVIYATEGTLFEQTYNDLNNKSVLIDDLNSVVYAVSNHGREVVYLNNDSISILKNGVDKTLINDMDMINRVYFSNESIFTEKLKQSSIEGTWKVSYPLGSIAYSDDDILNELYEDTEFVIFDSKTLTTSNYRENVNYSYEFIPLESNSAYLQGEDLASDLMITLDNDEIIITRDNETILTATRSSDFIKTKAESTVEEYLSQLNEIKIEEQESIALVTDTGGLGDQSFNDLSWAGMTRAEEAYNVTKKVLESETTDDFFPNMVSFAEENSDLIIGVGFLFNESMTQAAEKFPNQNFAIIDSVVEADNVASLTFKEHEGSFIVGVIAGLETKSDTVGFIGGMKFPLIEKYEYGFRAGVKAVNPNAEVLVSYADSFDDVAKGKEIAHVQHENGADVIYHVAGGVGIGLIQAAEEEGFWAIGVDWDQSALSPNSVLCSMVKRVDNAIYSVVKNMHEDSFEGGIYAFGLAESGVGYSDNAGNLSDEQKRIADQYVEAIINNTFHVPATQPEFEKFEIPSI